MPRHIGIVACSAEGAALCYRTLCIEGGARSGGHAHPEVSLHGPSLAGHVVDDARSPLPVLDSTRLLARAALLAADRDAGTRRASSARLAPRHRADTGPRDA